MISALTSSLRIPFGGKGILPLILGMACICNQSSLAQGSPLTSDELEDLNREAQQLFRQANALGPDEAEQARELYKKSVLRFERIVRDGGIENGWLYYNIGNAYFRMNDLGRAILNYLRAEQFIPHDANLQHNLQFARSRRVDQIEPKEKTKILKTLLFWHFDVPTQVRGACFLLTFVTIWILLALNLRPDRPRRIWSPAFCGLVSLFLLSSLVAEEISQARRQLGVIVDSEVIARKGDSETYAPSFTAALHAGTEFRLLEDRNEWIHIELMDGRTCWIPKATAELANRLRIENAKTTDQHR